MEYIAAFSLATQNSGEVVAKDSIRSKIIALLSSIQAPICEESLELFLSAVDGKTPSEILAAGGELMKSQLASAPSSSAASSSASQAADSKAPAAVEESSESADLDFF